MNQINVNPDYLRGLCHVAASKDVRYYLNGIFLEVMPRATRYTATNGHMLAILQDDVPSNEPDQAPAHIIIPRDTCKAAKRHKTLMATLAYPDGLPSADRGTADTDGELPECRIENLLNGGALVFRPINAKFPDYARVVPATTSGKPGAFQWKYLAAFDELAATAWGAKFAVHLYPNGTNDAATILCPSNPGFVGVVMPLRANDPSESAELPSWFTGRPDLKVAA